MQNKRTFASRFFELFTLPGSLKLNTQRRSVPSMRAFKEEERSVLISVTLMKGITGYKTVPATGITFCMEVKGPTMWQRLERKMSFLNCLFVCCFFCYPHFSFFFFLHFLLSAFFLPSAFFYPHFPIRIRHPQVSGPRFTDTPSISIYFLTARPHTILVVHQFNSICRYKRKEDTLSYIPSPDTVV